MERPKTYENIRQSIERIPDGTLFFGANFLEFGTLNSIRPVLKRLVEQEKITRVYEGIYSKLIFNNLLNEKVMPSPIDVAYAIAMKNNWSIFPTGKTAINIVGVSTQITTTYEFLSDGPYRNYEYDGFTIKFKHASTKKIKGHPDKLTILIIAITELALDINADDIDRLIIYARKNIAPEELAIHPNTVTDRVFQVLKIIKEEY